jgi:hypothetical protein
MDVDQFCEKVRRHVYGASRSMYSTLAAELTDADTTFSLADSINMGRGSVLGVGYELMYVSAVASGGELTVVRGFLGTTAVAHDTGALVELDPRFPRAHIRDTLIEELDSYYPDVFSAYTFSVAGTAASRQLDLGDAFSVLPSFGREPVLVLDVRGDFADDTYGARPWIPATARFTQAYDEDPSYVLQLEGYLRGDATVEVTIGFPITAFIDTDTVSFDTLDLLTIPGMRRELLDVATYGVAWRMMVTREIPRTQIGAQTASRNAEEVPPEHITRTAKALKDHRDRMLAHVVQSYRHLYPLRRVGL